MADEATLHDTLVADQTAPVQADANATSEVTVPDAPRIVEAPSPEAAEIGQILLNSGVTKDQLNDLLTAPKALDSLRYAIQNDPQDFLKMLERNDPATAEKFMDVVADTYVQRFGTKGKADGKPSGDTDPETRREIEALRETVNNLTTSQRQRDQAIADQAILQRYNSRVDDLLNLKEVKELVPTKSEQKNLRARLNVELGQDPAALQRVKSGNLVDVPRVFQTIIDEVAAEKKEAVKAAADKRDQVSKGAYPEFQNGPNPFLPPDVLEKASGSWDMTEAEFAKALERAR